MNGATVVIDAMIVAVPSATQAQTSAQALSSQAAATADVMYAELLLNTPSVPAVPADADEDLDLSIRLAEDTCVVIASVMTREIPLKELLDYR